MLSVGRAGSPFTGLLTSILTIFVLNRVNKYLEKTRLTQPKTTAKDPYLSWKWRNFLVSFIHSVITGIGAILCVTHQPNLVTDMLGAVSSPAYFLSCFSHGYFVHDLMEMIFNLKYKGSGELVFHHLFVISCLTISLLQNKYLGYACIALSIELSNIFLHLRQLLNICQYPKDSSLYLLNRWVNLIAFVLFRGSVQVFVTSKMLQHKDSVPGSVFFIASLCVMTVSVMTIVLFYRLLQSEFGSKDTDSFSSSFNQRKTIKSQSEAIKPNNGIAKCKHSLHDSDQSNGTLVFDESKAK